MTLRFGDISLEIGISHLTSKITSAVTLIYADALQSGAFKPAVKARDV